MKRVFYILISIVLAAIFLPLLAALFFLFPAELAVSTWQNLRIDSSVQGVITSSEVKVHRSRTATEASHISYSYQVDGQHYSSTKRWAGFIGNRSNEAGGGNFARNHPEGTAVEVFYSSSDPSFSLLERGVFKWSLGFPVLVWGILISPKFKRDDKRSPALLIGYPISRALPITGFFTIVALPSTLNGEALLEVLVAFLAFSLSALVWLLIHGFWRNRKRRFAHLRQPDSKSHSSD